MPPVSRVETSSASVPVASPRVLRAGPSHVRSALLAALLVCAAGCAPQDAPHFGWDTSVPGKTIARRMCSDCHGLDGNPTSPQFPRLAGQQKVYLVKQLTEFQTEHRWDPTGTAYMWGVARELTPKQVDEIAAYFSAQTPARGAAGDATLESEGKALYMNGIPKKEVPPCAGCHGNEGLGAGDVPRLADQWSHYLLEQLGVFSTEERPAAVAMHAIVVHLTPRDKLALATYLQSMGKK
jgi:cytochrome c553